MDDFATKILTMLNQIIFLEKKNILECRGITLYPSEIHLLLVISRDQPTNATRMAEKLGITKGAVSQTLTRLEKKGILTKSKDPYNKNELTAELTPLGVEAYDQYQAFHTSLLQKCNSHFETFSASEREVILTFLSRLSAILNDLPGAASAGIKAYDN